MTISAARLRLIVVALLQVPLLAQPPISSGQGGSSMPDSRARPGPPLVP